ncbi:MAG: S24 family peptidase [Coprobacter sp.]|nr:S24 family peptidase [Coprobacter sp.]
MSTVRDRIVLFARSKGQTIAGFERSIGVSAGYIKNIARSIPPDVLESLSGVYPDLSIEWLMIGKGEMLKRAGSRPVAYAPSDGEGISSRAGEPMVYYGGRESIPLVADVKATCGVPDGFSVAIRRDDCMPVVVPGLTGDFAIRAKGRSMINRSNPEKSINENNIIVCNRWTSRSYVRWGEVYVLATRDGVVVKQLMPSAEEGCVRCVSFNEEEGYRPFDLPVSEICDWAIVVGVVGISLFA